MFELFKPNRLIFMSGPEGTEAPASQDARVDDAAEAQEEGKEGPLTQEEIDKKVAEAKKIIEAKPPVLQIGNETFKQDSYPELMKTLEKGLKEAIVNDPSGGKDLSPLDLAKAWEYRATAFLKSQKEEEREKKVQEMVVTSEDGKSIVVGGEKGFKLSIPAGTDEAIAKKTEVVVERNLTTILQKSGKYSLEEGEAKRFAADLQKGVDSFVKAENDAVKKMKEDSESFSKTEVKLTETPPSIQIGTVKIDLPEGTDPSVALKTKVALEKALASAMQKVGKNTFDQSELDAFANSAKTEVAEFVKKESESLGKLRDQSKAALDFDRFTQRTLDQATGRLSIEFNFIMRFSSQDPAIREKEATQAILISLEHKFLNALGVQSFLTGGTIIPQSMKALASDKVNKSEKGWVNRLDEPGNSFTMDLGEMQKAFTDYVNANKTKPGETPQEGATKEELLKDRGSWYLDEGADKDNPKFTETVAAKLSEKKYGGPAPTVSIVSDSTPTGPTTSITVNGIEYAGEDSITHSNPALARADAVGKIEKDSLDQVQKLQMDRILKASSSWRISGSENFKRKDLKEQLARKMFDEGYDEKTPVSIRIQNNKSAEGRQSKEVTIKLGKDEFIGIADRASDTLDNKSQEKADEIKAFKSAVKLIKKETPEKKDKDKDEGAVAGNKPPEIGITGGRPPEDTTPEAARAVPDPAQAVPDAAAASKESPMDAGPVRPSEEAGKIIFHESHDPADQKMITEFVGALKMDIQAVRTSLAKEETDKYPKFAELKVKVEGKIKKMEEDLAGTLNSIKEGKLNLTQIGSAGGPPPESSRENSAKELAATIISEAKASLNDALTAEQRQVESGRIIDNNSQDLKANLARRAAEEDEDGPQVPVEEPNPTPDPVRAAEIKEITPAQIALDVNEILTKSEWKFDQNLSELNTEANKTALAQVFAEKGEVPKVLTVRVTPGLFIKTLTVYADGETFISGNKDLNKAFSAIVDKIKKGDSLSKKGDKYSQNREKYFEVTEQVVANLPDEVSATYKVPAIKGFNIELFLENALGTLEAEAFNAVVKASEKVGLEVGGKAGDLYNWIRENGARQLAFESLEDPKIKEGGTKRITIKLSPAIKYELARSFSYRDKKKESEKKDSGVGALGGRAPEGTAQEAGKAAPVEAPAKAEARVGATVSAPVITEQADDQAKFETILKTVQSLDFVKNNDFMRGGENLDQQLARVMMDNGYDEKTTVSIDSVSSNMPGVGAVVKTTILLNGKPSSWTAPVSAGKAEANAFKGALSKIKESKTA